MKIGELAALARIAPSTIRYYERVGLMAAPQRVSGQRSFSKQAVKDLKFIQLAQAGGFTITEIKTIINGYPKTNVRDQWHTLAQQKKAEIQLKMRELEQVESVLDALLTCECTTIEECVETALQTRDH